MANMARTGVSLIGQTGTGNFVGSTSPTLVTPVLGVSSATSINFSSTSGIIGTTTNNTPAAGSVGEIISSQVAFGSAQALTSNSILALTTISLTAGDWDIYASVGFTGGATTLVRHMHAWTAITTGSAPNSALITSVSLGTTGVAIFAQGFYGMAIKLNTLLINATTTTYLNVRSTFTTSTCSCFGKIWARRTR